MKRAPLAVIIAVGTAMLSAQTPDDDPWPAEGAFEEAITAKQTDALLSMFHPDFSGIDSDGSTYSANAYMVRRASEAYFFDVDADRHPGGSVAVGYVLAKGGVQRFSHVWLHSPQGWRLVAAQATAMFPRSATPDGPSRDSGGDQQTFITAQTPWPSGSPEASILDAYRGLVRAEHGRDVNGWARLTDDHFWAIAPRGQKDGKGARFTQIGRLTTDTPLPIISELQIHVYGDLAIMRGVQEPVRPPTLRFTRVWVRQGGEWRQALNHATFVNSSSEKQ